MKDFFLSLLYAAVAGGIASAVAGKGFEKQVRCLSALLCAAVIATPLLAAFSELCLEVDISTSHHTLSQSENALIARQAAEDAEKAVDAYIFKETGIRAEAVSIEIESVEGELYFKRLSVRTADPDSAARVRSCLEELVGGEMEIEVTP